MGSMPQAARPFNALSGMEIKRAILADLTRQLDGDTRFSQHLSYPLVTWKFRLAVDAYPPEIGKFEINLQGKVSSSNPRPIDDEEEEPIEMDFKGGRSVLAPAGGQTADAVRRDTGQAVPAPKVVRGPENSRVVVEQQPVDALQLQPGQDAEVTAREPESPRKGVAARVASLRTRANPEGALAKEPEGSAPESEEDFAKIAENIAKANESEG